jgi:hypothetical protein
LALKEFPVPASREFDPQGAENAREIRHENRAKRTFLRKFPAKFPVNGKEQGTFRVPPEARMPAMDRSLIAAIWCCAGMP